MALRADSSDSSEKTAAGGSSAVAGLPSYWDVAECSPKTEWEKEWDMFVMAVNAKHSIVVPELTRIGTEQQPHQAALLNNMQEQAAERKIVSILFLSLESAGRKNLTEKFPYMVVSGATLREMQENCEQTLIKPHNLTLDRYKFFARKQKSR